MTDINSNKEEVKIVLSKLHNRLIEHQEKADLYKSYQRFFRVEMTKYDILNEASEAVRLRTLLWDSTDEWEKIISTWEEDNFHNLDVEQMNTFLALNFKNVMQFKKGLPRCELVNIIDEKVESFKHKMPVITMLRNPDLRSHHWAKIEHILDTKFPTNKPLTLIMLEELDAFKYGSEIMEVAGQASSEATLESMLKKVEDSWKDLYLIVLPYKNLKDIFILGSLEEVQITLEETNMVLNTLITSKHILMVKARVEEWMKSMLIMNDILVSNLIFDGKWFYTFISKTIQISFIIINTTKCTKVICLLKIIITQV